MTYIWKTVIVHRKKKGTAVFCEQWLLWDFTHKTSGYKNLIEFKYLQYLHLLSKFPSKIVLFSNETQPLVTQPLVKNWVLLFSLHTS